ncbi:MAG TPA: CAP domain-containing protein [Chitinophagaceae bacterium]|nr:CAP domain-containing protein [Chitinophagaceae bacterium]
MLNTDQSFHRISLSFFTTCLLLLLVSFISKPEGITDDVLKYTNQFRKAKGLPALIMRNDLNAIADKHSEDMAKGRCDFGHDGYEKRETQVKRIFQSCSMAENVAYGASTGKEVVSLWKNSSGHRRNMLGNYKYIGIGIARDRRGIVYYTQIFVR